MGFGKELLILGFVCASLKPVLGCEFGYQANYGENCTDVDECADTPPICGNNSWCNNTLGSYFCSCVPGFYNPILKRTFNFTAEQGECRDVNECLENTANCGPHASCKNLIGSYECICNSGYKKTSANGSSGHCEDFDECFEKIANCGPHATCKDLIGSYECSCNSGYEKTSANNSSGHCEDVDECMEAQKKEEDICGEKGTCINLDGSYRCKCEEGYTAYGNERTRCSELECDSFSGDSSPAKSLGGLADILSMMKNSCLALSGGGKADGDALLEKLLTAADTILTPGDLESSKDVSGLLSTVERSILLIGPQMKGNGTKMETQEMEAEIAVRRGITPPTGPIHLTSEHAHLNTDWSTAAGTGSYPGFALAALLSYKNLGASVNRSFEDLKEKEKDALSFQVFSKVVSVVVSNPSTQNLSTPVNITFSHLEGIKQNPEARFICAYWNERGVWSPDGCSQEQSNATHTVCSCGHLSSFAVLMALYPMKPSFELQLLTKIGLTISLVCLVLSILTFKFCRSIQGTRTTIHLHLCICLLVADLVFLVGISRTRPEGGCKFVAAMLHFFFLGVMTWMLLEGVQLYRMVVLVFNATIRPVYLYITGYGVPLGIVILSAIIRPGGYGTDNHCWLSLEHGLIWSFFGPVCFIIVLNIFFFLVTVWKLAQKFATLNPDLSKLHKIKAFTVTAIAQMCILGLMWVFGAFLFSEGTTAVAYIFTILNSLQGALVFIMHCLLSKQVRDEYVQFLSCICTPQKKRYSDLSSTNPSSSQSQGSRSGQITGESQI